MLFLNEKGIDVFFKKFNSKFNKGFWNNYTVNIWKKNVNGWGSKKGMYLDESWGIVDKVPVSKNGMWVIKKDYVKYFK